MSELTFLDAQCWGYSHIFTWSDANAPMVEAEAGGLSFTYTIKWPSESQYREILDWLLSNFPGELTHTAGAVSCENRHPTLGMIYDWELITCLRLVPQDVSEYLPTKPGSKSLKPLDVRFQSYLVVNISHDVAPMFKLRFR